MLGGASRLFSPSHNHVSLSHEQAFDSRNDDDIDMLQDCDDVLMPSVPDAEAILAEDLSFI